MIAEFLPAKSILALLMLCSEFGIGLPWVPKETKTILHAFDQYKDDLEYQWIDARRAWETRIKDLARLVEVSALNCHHAFVERRRLTRSFALDLSNESDSLNVYMISYNNRVYICGVEVSSSNIIGYQSRNKHTVKRLGQISSFRFSSDSIGIRSICLSSCGWIPESPKHHGGYEGHRQTLHTPVLVITLDVRNTISDYSLRS